MRAAKLDLLLRPGATFIGRIFICLDSEDNPVDLTGYVPFAQVRLNPLDAVLIDLQPTLISTGQVVGNCSVAPPTSVITLPNHGLIPGNGIQFSSSNQLPAPLDAAEIYIILSQNFSGNTFSVCLLSSALLNDFGSINIEDSGIGSLKATVVPGQILMPEISDENTEQYQDSDAGWDLMLEDPNGRRLAAFVEGKFTIRRGYTDPALP